MRSSGPDEKTAPFQLRPGPHARIHTTLYEAPAHAPTQRPRFGAAGQAALQFSISCCIEFHVAGQRPSHPAFPLPPFVAEHTHRTLRWSQSLTIVFRTLMVPVRTGGLVSDPVADPSLAHTLPPRTPNAADRARRLPRPQSYRGNSAFTSVLRTPYGFSPFPSLSRSFGSFSFARSSTRPPRPSFRKVFSSRSNV